MQEHIGFSNGNVQIGNGVEIDGNILSGIIGKAVLPIKIGKMTLTTVECWVGQGVDFTAGTPDDPYHTEPFLFAIISLLEEEGAAPTFSPICTRYASETDYDLCRTMKDLLERGFIPNELGAKGVLVTDAKLKPIVTEIAEIKSTASRSRYQHTVTLSGDGFEFCFTARSSKNLMVDSYQDLGIVFGGERIGLTGYSAALSAKPVLIDLHGGSESSDFIRVFEENGNTFANHTLSSLGAITFADDVYIPN